MTTDPRSIVTPDAFSVTPDLLGTPLAEPWRRFVALMIDLVLIGFLQLLGWRVLGGIAALMLLRMATRRSDGAVSSRGRKVAMGCAGAFVLVVAVGITSLIPAALRMVNPGGDNASVATDTASGGVANPGSLGGTVAGVLSGLTGARNLAGAENEEEALDAAVELGRVMITLGADRVAVRTAIEDFVDDNTDFDGDDIARLVDDALFGEPGAGAVLADSPPVSPLEQALTDSVTALHESLADVRSDLRESEADLEDTRDALAEAESRSTLFTWIRDAADEAGLIFGWGTVYLTLFLALWQGRTPGKKVLGLRVVRLNGQPLGLFMSLERAGGYAAGVATGLLGFAQVWWDPNRQAIHDKITETVVIREGLPNRLHRERGAAEGVAEAAAGGKDRVSGRGPSEGPADRVSEKTGGQQA
ncbi:MAG: RDD family protein [Gemmatimonadetes bacterium]|nr:RDD family protein [Gemmatimonadota bacterium]